MIALRAQYNNGRIELLEPMPSEIIHAKLNIVVIPDEIQSDKTIPVAEYFKTDITSEKDFKNLGMNSFFNEEDDVNVDWEDIFGIKEIKK